MLSADHLLEKLSDLDTVTLELLEAARDSGDIRTALVAVREARATIEAYARLGVMSELERRVALLEAPIAVPSNCDDDRSDDNDHGDY